MAEHIQVYNPSSEKPYATAPTPKNSDGSINISDISNKIATTELVYNVIDKQISFCVKSVNGSIPDDNGNVILGTTNGIVPVGSIIAFASNSTPDGYLICNGSNVSRTTYSDLFNVIGELYGSGDGSTTFKLPNLVDRFIQGSETAGTTKSAGLPNISGDLESQGTAGGRSTGNDSLSSSLFKIKRVGTIDGGTSSAASYQTAVNFNASLVDSIYGNSSTVQPPALTMRFYIKY